MHALLAVRQMRSVVATTPAFGQATGVALQQNTDGLPRLVGSAYGDTQADGFTKLWQRHLADLMAYPKGVAGHDSRPHQGHGGDRRSHQGRRVPDAVAGNDQNAKTVAKQNLGGFAERLAL